MLLLRGHIPGRHPHPEGLSREHSAASPLPRLPMVLCLFDLLPGCHRCPLSLHRDHPMSLADTPSLPCSSVPPFVPFLVHLDPIHPSGPNVVSQGPGMRGLRIWGLSPSRVQTQGVWGFLELQKLLS